MRFLEWHPIFCNDCFRVIVLKEKAVISPGKCRIDFDVCQIAFLGHSQIVIYHNFISAN